MRVIAPCLAVFTVTTALATAGVSAQRQAGSVVGIALDSASSPIAGVLVFIDGNARLSIRADAEGAFRLPGLSEGAHVLSFRGLGLAPHEISLTLSAGRDLDLGGVTLMRGPRPTATVEGRVTDGEGGQPLPGAQVELNGTGGTIADDDGMFRLADVPVSWGHNELRVQRLGYGEVTEDLWIIDTDEDVAISVALRAVPVELPGVVVESALRPAPPLDLMAGFRERRAGTTGFFLDQSEIEERAPGDLTTLVRSVPGIRVRPAIEGTEVMFTRRTRSLGLSLGDGVSTPGDCRSPLIYLDGSLVVRDTDRYVALDELVSPEIIAGFEAYNGASRIPTMFNTMGSGCGVLAIWTVGSPTGGGRAASTAPDLSQLSAGGSSVRRKVILGAILIPAAALALKSMICSLPHYC